LFLILGSELLNAKQILQQGTKDTPSGLSGPSTNCIHQLAEKTQLDPTIT
jgi:hypothetical protein